MSLDEFAQVEMLAKEWHHKTPPEDRTIENFASFLSRSVVGIPATLMMLRQHRDFVYRMLAGILRLNKLEYKLSKLLANAVLGRPMHEIQEYGWQFFLDHFQDHPFLEPLIRASVGDVLRLQVYPVFPADGNLTAWLFNPWHKVAYTFSLNQPLDREYRVRKDGGVTILSVAPESICAKYDGADHPFSKEYLRRVDEARNAQFLQSVFNNL